MDLILDLKKQVPKNEDFTPERSLKTKVLTGSSYLTKHSPFYLLIASYSMGEMFH